MSDLGARLAYVRDALGLSLRRTAAILEERGYPVSHNTVHKYEHGRTVPAEYAEAFSDVFGCRLEWLLRGVGRPFGSRLRPAEGSTLSLVPGHPDLVFGEAISEGAGRSHVRRIRREWERFVETGRTPGAVRPTILRSWRRSRAAGVEPAPSAESLPPRISREALEERRGRSGRLLDAALAHVAWLSLLHQGVGHVVCLVCREGIVLVADGRPEELRERWHLLPGFDRSEAAVGTNGAGTALATGEPTVVMGPEHYVESFHDCTCIGAPILGSGSGPVGALDLTTKLDEGDPRSIFLVAYAAETIGARLRRDPHA